MVCLKILERRVNIMKNLLVLGLEIIDIIDAMDIICDDIDSLIFVSKFNT